MELKTLLCLFVILGCVFDSQHHGNDIYIIQNERQEFSESLWEQRIAICLAFVLLMCLMFVIELCELDLITGWFLFASLLTIFNAIVYFNPSSLPSLTYIAASLKNGVGESTQIFLVSILLLNGGTGISNLVLTVIPFGIGHSFWILVLQKSSWNYHKEILLTMLLFRSTMLLIALYCYFSTDITQNMTTFPGSRKASRVLDAASDLNRLEYSIVWTNIFIAAFSIVLPDLWASSTSPDYEWPEEITLETIINILMPTIVGLTSIFILSRIEQSQFKESLLLSGSIAAALACVTGMLVVFASSWISRVLLKISLWIYTSCFVLVICIFSVLSDLIVDSGEVFYLSLYVQSRASLIAQSIIFIASFIDETYISIMIYGSGSAAILAVFITMVVYINTADDANSLRERRVHTQDDDSDSNATNKST